MGIHQLGERLGLVTLPVRKRFLENASDALFSYNLLAAAQNAPPPSDREITQAVVAEIVRNDRFYTMRDLKITTSNGRVTLASHRKSERQTQQLVAAASRVVGAAKVDNQLATPSSQ